MPAYMIVTMQRVLRPLRRKKRLTKFRPEVVIAASVKEGKQAKLMEKEEKE